MVTFSISVESARELRELAKLPDDHAAITRLEQGIGRDRDLERIAALYELAGKVAVARELRRAL